MNTSLRRALVWVVLLTLAAFALRLFQLDSQSIWWDEGISLHLATSSAAEIVRDRLNNIHPPLYFFLLKGWLALTGVTVFTARYLSVLAALLQVPFVLAFTRAISRRAAGQQPSSQPYVLVAAWIAAGLTAIAPLSVIYGQEVRVYAFLPLVFIALLWLGERMTLAERLSPRYLVALGVTEWLGLHLHYIAVFGVAYVAAWGVLALARRQRRDLLWRWLGLHTIVALACLPWFTAVVSNWSAVQAEAGAGTFATEPVPLAFLFGQVWAFQLTGLAGALGTPLVRILAGLAFVAFVALVILRLARWDQAASKASFPPEHALWGQRVRLLSHWALPLATALVVWSLRSFSHPRYVTMYTIAFLPLAGVLIWPARRWATRLAAAIFALLVVLLSLWGLQRYFFNPDSAKPDVRGVAHFLAGAATAGDVILVPDTDWSLPFEYKGAATIVMATLGDSATHLPDELAAALDCGPAGETGEGCAPARDVFVVDYVRGTRDWQSRVPFELERRGTLQETVALDDLVVSRYALDKQTEPLPTCPVGGATTVQFGSLALRGGWIEPAAGNSALTVALCWSAAPGSADELHAAVSLFDPVTGEQVGQASLPLRDATGRPAAQWQGDAPVTTYHVVPLLPGTPPLAYDVLVSVFNLQGQAAQPVEVIGAGGTGAGQQTLLGQVRLVKDSSPDNPYDLSEPPRLTEPAPVAPGVTLEGAVIGGGQYRPGQTVRVGLLWRRLTDALSGFSPEMRLEQSGRLLASNSEQPAQERYPASEWSEGELVREVRDLRLPPDANGQIALVLQSGPTRLELGTIAVAGDGVLFDQPSTAAQVNIKFADVADLVGFTLESESLAPDGILSLTLVWRAQTDTIGTDYAVFVHLLDEQGRLIGQHDSIPANGTRPTSDWLEGEYIVDPHPLALRDTAYVGPARISVGLYDPATGTRIVTADGLDAYQLPVEVEVIPQP